MSDYTYRDKFNIHFRCQKRKEERIVVFFLTIMSNLKLWIGTDKEKFIAGMKIRDSQPKLPEKVDSSYII